MPASTDVALNVPLLSQGHAAGQYPGGPGLMAGEAVEVSQLVGGKFSTLVNILQESGVKKLGSLTANAVLVSHIMDDSGMLAMGAETMDMDWRGVWQEQLDLAARKVHRSDFNSGWLDDMTLDAYTVRLANAALPDERGLLRHLVLAYNRGSCGLQVFGLPAVQAVIAWKWKRYTHKLLLLQLAMYCCWLASFTGFVILIQDEDESQALSAIWATSRGRGEVVCELLAIAAMAPFVYVELSTFGSYGLIAWVTSWNLLDTLMFVCQVVITILHLRDDTRHLTGTTPYQALLAAQTVMMYMKLQYFTRVFTPGKPTLVDTMATVVADLGSFFAFYVLLVWAFALAFYSLFANDQEQFEDFATIWQSMVATFSALNGGLEYQAFLASRNPVLMSAVYVIFQFAMVMVLANLIMGFVVNGVSKVSEDSGLKQLLCKASLIDEVDSSMPAWLEARLPRKWFPRFVHVLKINPHSVDKVRLDPDWPVQGANGLDNDSADKGDDGDENDGIAFDITEAHRPSGVPYHAPSTSHSTHPAALLGPARTSASGHSADSALLQPSAAAASSAKEQIQRQGLYDGMHQPAQPDPTDSMFETTQPRGLSGGSSVQASPAVKAAVHGVQEELAAKAAELSAIQVYLQQALAQAQGASGGV